MNLTNIHRIYDNQGSIKEFEKLTLRSAEVRVKQLVGGKDRSHGFTLLGEEIISLHRRDRQPNSERPSQT